MVTFALRRATPVTLADWERRGWLEGLVFVRVESGGTVVRCPNCQGWSGRSRIYLDGGLYRVLSICECGHCFEVIRGGLS